MSKTGIEGYKAAPKYEDAREWVLQVVRALDKDWIEWQGFTVRPKGTEVMVVLRARQAEAHIVAFVWAKDLGAAMRATLHRARNGGLKWRPDKYHSTTAKKAQDG